MSLLIKYCGNRSFQDYELVRDTAATHIGFIFVESSKRYVVPEDVVKWIQKLPPKPHQKMVGIFVNPTPQQLRNFLKVLPLDVIQLHGDEQQSLLTDLRSFFDGEVWKVVHHSERALEGMNDYADLVDAFLIDSKVAGQWGGTGQAFDWQFVPNYLEEAHRLGIPCVIAGGVRPENVETLLSYHPDGIDLASGIEENETKSMTRIQALERKVVSR